MPSASFQTGHPLPPEAPMSEGITEVCDPGKHIAHVRYWEAAYKDPASGPHFRGHGVVAGLLGEYADLLEKMARQERLPLATPEMVADAERLDWMERDHNALVYPALRVQSGADGFGVTVKHEEGRGFSPNGKLREAIDAARAARPEGQNHE